MTWFRTRGWLGTVIRLALGVVLIWAGLPKVRSPRLFLQTVRAFDATPDWLTKAIAYGLPVLELSLGVLLVLGLAVRIWAVVAAVLFVVFLVGLIQAGARGLHVSWGAFDLGGPTTGSTYYLLESLIVVVLLLGAIFLALWPLTRLSVDEFAARNDYVEEPSAKRMRTDQGRRKYQAQVEAKQQAARVRARYLYSGLAIVVVLVAVIAIGVQGQRSPLKQTSTSNVSITNGVIYGKKAAATIDVYADFGSPAARSFWASSSAPLIAEVKANTAQLRIHPITVLDHTSDGTGFSTRAANAALCARDVTNDAFIKYVTVLFRAASSTNLSDSQLVALARQAKVSGASLTTFTSCVEQAQHSKLAQAISDHAATDESVVTPFVIKVNGTTISSPTLAKIDARITSALRTGPKPSPSPTAKPSPKKSTTSSKAATSKSASPSPSG